MCRKTCHHEDYPLSEQTEGGGFIIQWESTGLREKWEFSGLNGCPRETTPASL